MKYQTLALSLGLLGLALSASSARAQGHGGYGFSSSGGSRSSFAHGRTAGRGFILARRGHRFYSNSAFAPNYYPYYDPYFYSYYDSDDPSVPSLPPPPVWQAPESPSSTAPSKPVESLVMELRGDHWVRLTNYGATDPGEPARETQPAPGRSTAPSKSNAAPLRTEPPSELPPAVLVFRDGHQLQTAKYTIVGGTIYLKGDYWTTGSWNRPVPIADLDLAATLQLNQQRGVKFALPSRPSEVIVR